MDATAEERAAGASRAPGEVRVGTSGYSFKDWIGPFYPPGTKVAEQLPLYARHFDCLEVNVTYYRVPDAQLLEGMSRRTPEGFHFILKLHGDMTHRASRDDGLYRDFNAALRPLQDAGNLHGLLAQFPYRFKNTQANRHFVAELRERFANHPLFVEFRHAGWAIEPVFAWLRKLAIGWVSVDEPDLPGLLPREARATSDVGYVRLHGRNAENWWEPGRGGGDRYDYLYSQEELQEWVRKIRSLLQETRRTYVFFNNCHAGKAPSNAQAMKELLSELGL
ncbi:MAG: DUF72 domain-containing protein [Candidatus Latescibacterota bacterium]|nr:MAG: DUF72 domain-containing protein [Candidatus Latescibacterota bacterium]